MISLLNFDFSLWREAAKKVNQSNINTVNDFLIIRCGMRTDVVRSEEPEGTGVFIKDPVTGTKREEFRMKEKEKEINHPYQWGVIAQVPAILDEKLAAFYRVGQGVLYHMSEGKLLSVRKDREEGEPDLYAVPRHAIMSVEIEY